MNKPGFDQRKAKEKEGVVDGMRRSELLKPIQLLRDCLLELPFLHRISCGAIHIESFGIYSVLQTGCVLALIPIYHYTSIPGL